MNEACPNPAMHAACDSALAGHRAYAFLHGLFEAMEPTHPDRAAVQDTLDLLRAEWLGRVGTVSRLPAADQPGLLLKAAVLSRLIERDEADAVTGGPAMQLAASLADDILAQP